MARIEAQNKALDELLKKANETILATKKTLPEKQKALKPAQEAKESAQKALDEAIAAISKGNEAQPDGALEKQKRSAQEKLATATMAETSALAAVAAVENNVKDADGGGQGNPGKGRS